MKTNRNVLVIADIGYASPYWPHFCEYLARDEAWEITILSPSMSQSQKKFFNIPDANDRHYKILESKRFRMEYRRNDGRNKYIRKCVSAFKVVEIALRKCLRLTGQNVAFHSDWVEIAINDVRRLNLKNPLDLIISTCLPFETHVIASTVSKQLSLPWIADYRDPFTFSHTRTSDPTLDQIQYESSVLSGASYCTTTSVGFGLEISKVYNGPVKVIHNGFDSLELKSKVKFKAPIRIVYHGSIYEHFQRLDVILEALQMVYQSGLDHEDLPIEIQFGGFSTHLVTKYFETRNLPIPKWISLVGVTSVAEAKKIQQSADFLLLLNWEDSQQLGVMQTKLYEYISSGVPVIATGGGGTDESTKLLESAGNSFLFTNPKDLSRFLLNFLETKAISKDRDLEFIKFFSRKEQAKQLSLLMESLIGSK